jgi:hypothetical protein
MTAFGVIKTDVICNDPIIKKYIEELIENKVYGEQFEGLIEERIEINSPIEEQQYFNEKVKPEMKERLFHFINFCLVTEGNNDYIDKFDIDIKQYWYCHN